MSIIAKDQELTLQQESRLPLEKDTSQVFHQICNLNYLTESLVEENLRKAEAIKKERIEAHLQRLKRLKGELFLQEIKYNEIIKGKVDIAMAQFEKNYKHGGTPHRNVFIKEVCDTDEEAKAISAGMKSLQDEINNTDAKIEYLKSLFGKKLLLLMRSHYGAQFEQLDKKFDKIKDDNKKLAFVPIRQDDSKTSCRTIAKFAIAFKFMPKEKSRMLEYASLLQSEVAGKYSIKSLEEATNHILKHYREMPENWLKEVLDYTRYFHESFQDSLLGIAKREKK